MADALAPEQPLPLRELAGLFPHGPQPVRISGPDENSGCVPLPPSEWNRNGLCDKDLRRYPGSYPE